MLLDPTTAGPPLRGVARSRTLQEGLSSITDAPETLWSLGLIGDWHTWLGQFRSGRFGDTVRVGVRSLRGLVRAWLPSVGTLLRHLPSGVVVDFGTLPRHLGLCDWLVTGTRGLASFARDASAIPCA